jgi:threonine dehydratase
VAAALSGGAGRGKVVAVVSGGNINLSTFAAFVQDSSPDNPQIAKSSSVHE